MLVDAVFIFVEPVDPLEPELTEPEPTELDVVPPLAMLPLPVELPVLLPTLALLVPLPIVPPAELLPTVALP